jgi:hypothetical protein
VTSSFSFVTFVFASGFALLQMFQAERKQSIGAQTIRQEQPLVTHGPPVRPEDKQKCSVDQEDPTRYGENSRFMRRDYFPGVAESSHAFPLRPF